MRSSSSGFTSPTHSRNNARSASEICFRELTVRIRSDGLLIDEARAVSRLGKPNAWLARCTLLSRWRRGLWLGLARYIGGILPDTSGCALDEDSLRAINRLQSSEWLGVAGPHASQARQARGDGGDSHQH